MTTAVTEVTVVKTRRKGIFRRFGEAVWAGIRRVGRTSNRAGRATGRFFGRQFRKAKNVAKSAAAGSRRFGAWTWDTLIVPIPRVARRVIGWTLRGFSWVVQTGLWGILGLLAIFAVAALVVGWLGLQWEENVHERTVNMSRGGNFWDKNDLTPPRTATTTEDDAILVTDAMYSRTAHEARVTTPSQRVSGTAVPDFTTMTAKQAQEIIALGNVQPPADVTEHLLERHWKSLSKHFKGNSYEDREVSSHFFGRALAARSFLGEPRNSALSHEDGWYVARESKSIDQRNQAAGQGNPELALNVAAVKRGIVDEIHRLKEVYASVDS